MACNTPLMISAKLEAVPLQQSSSGLPHCDCYAEQMSLLQLEIKRRTDEIEKKTKEVDLLNRKLERLNAASQGEENLGGC